MSKINFRFLSPPQSINSAYYLKGNGKVRTKECREWGDELLIQLLEYKQQIVEFMKTYDPKKHGFKVSIVHYIPAPYYYNMEKLISSRSPDLSNIEKLPIDILFDSRFHGRYIRGKKAFNLNVNDKCNISLTSDKLPDTKYIIDIEVSLKDLPQWDWENPVGVMDI